ncbi:TerB N-terminal domain-containing protein [Novosphingobium sp. BW1]|uniref:tellurite resistance TerB family protein n=1 Tax=Novosphingobium sp. BW1 TaxID=2592621 RepID=UPI001396A87B|nr:TerB N-terminal domain-containing protein [Novosphingobium sp. BW1]
MSTNGRYLCGGYSFSNLQQASEYAARIAKPIAAAPKPITSAPARAISMGPRAPACWLATATTLQIGSRSAKLDMVYYGTPARYDPKHDKSRIDPLLPINPEGDPTGATLTYWQSYDGLEPRARWTYLEWLEGGRTNPDIPIGYVFVFFYGLEQRLLVDDAKDEASTIFAEIRRLLEIYGENYSFASYASRLLALACLYDEDRDEPIASAPSRNYEMELPLNVRVRLGRRIEEGQPFNADDCILWVLSLPDVYLRTPGQRCFDELLELWRVRFAARNPEGLRVRRPKSKIRSQYQAASNTFFRSIEMELPDISGTRAPLNGLRTILDGCIEDLSAYSRLLGRDPDARGRLRGDLLLPLELHPGRSSFAACRSVLDKAVAGGFVMASDVAQALDFEIEPGTEKLPANLVRQMGVALDALDLGFEPDRRYGPAATLRADARIALFDASLGGPVDSDRSAYAAARVMVEVATLAAVSDGTVVSSEMDAIERRLRATSDLKEEEVVRLLACAKALAADPPKVRAALKKLADVAPESRAALAASAVEAVLADGRVIPDEVRFLEELHVALGLPASALYSALHRSGEDVGPVEVLPATAEHLVPLPIEPTPSGVAIDGARLERIRGETRQVSAMLAAIFVEEQPDYTPAPPPKANPTTSAFAGLDGPHSDLLLRLLSDPMPRSEFDAAAAELRLMPDGAIETLNEWGFDTLGEPIVEDDDNVRISPDVIDQLEPIGVAA